MDGVLRASNDFISRDIVTGGNRRYASGAVNLCKSSPEGQAVGERLA